MSTRGTKNEDIGREYCRLLASLLGPDDPYNDTDWQVAPAAREAAIQQVRAWMAAIADGADPADVIFGGHPSANNRFSDVLAEVVRIRMERHGISQHKALMQLARERAGPDEQQVKRAFDTLRQNLKRHKRRN